MPGSDAMDFDTAPAPFLIDHADCVTRWGILAAEERIEVEPDATTNTVKVNTTRPIRVRSLSIKYLSSANQRTKNSRELPTI